MSKATLPPVQLTPAAVAAAALADGPPHGESGEDLLTGLRDEIRRIPDAVLLEIEQQLVLSKRRLKDVAAESSAQQMTVLEWTIRQAEALILKLLNWCLRLLGSNVVFVDNTMEAAVQPSTPDDALLALVREEIRERGLASAPRPAYELEAWRDRAIVNLRGAEAAARVQAEGRTASEASKQLPDLRLAQEEARARLRRALAAASPLGLVIGDAKLRLVEQQDALDVARASAEVLDRRVAVSALLAHAADDAGVLGAAVDHWSREVERLERELGMRAGAEDEKPAHEVAALRERS